MTWVALRRVIKAMSDEDLLRPAVYFNSQTGQFYEVDIVEAKECAETAPQGMTLLAAYDGVTF